MRWFTSDLHFGHVNISRFCNRPFIPEGTDQPDVDRMNTTIVDTINSRVQPDDELWVLGDVAMGSIDSTLALRAQIAATRVFLVPGNHDRCHPMNPKADQWLPRYLDAGWEVLDPITSVNFGDDWEVDVCHFPFGVDPGEARAMRGETVDRFTEWRPADRGQWLLCGHVHDAFRQSGRAINVGVDAWAGAPVSETEIAYLMAEEPQDRAILPWVEPAS